MEAASTACACLSAGAGERRQRKTAWAALVAEGQTRRRGVPS